MRKTAASIAIGLVVVAALTARPGVELPVVEASPSTVFNFTGAEQVYSVPPGITRVTIEARGGKGGNSAAVPGIPSCAVGAFGGVGEQVTVTYTLPLGVTQLFVMVGGNGSGPAGGFNGGGAPFAAQNGAGGGGASDVRLTSGVAASRFVVAAGGGGAGGCGNGQATMGGTGGNASVAGGNGAPAVGAGGGGADGGTGGVGGLAGTHNPPGTPPTAGTPAGAGGDGGFGAAQTTQGGGGGGGGGGMTGGGGGGAGASLASGNGGGGGGGGGSFAGAGTASESFVPHPDGQASVGRVTITPIDPPLVTKSFNPDSIQVNGSSIVGLVIANTNAFPLTGLTFNDNLPAGVTVNGAPAAFGGLPYCSIGTVATTATSIRWTGGALPGNSSCAIGASVTSASPGTYVNNQFLVATAQLVAGSTNPATLVVSALPASTATATPTPTVTPTSIPLAPVVPIIPQVFQQVPQGIFYGNRSTQTPVVARAVVAPGIDLGVMPILRPPSTGDAGLKARRGVSRTQWSP